MCPASVVRLCVTAVLFALPASGGERIAVIAPGLEAQGQLEDVFCVSQHCVPSGSVLSGGRLDARKLKQQDVAFTVSANRVKSGLEVQLKDAAGQVRYEQVLEAGTGGKLSVGPLVTMAAKVIDSIENGNAQKPQKNLAAMRAWAARQKAAKAAQKKKNVLARGGKRPDRG